MVVTSYLFGHFVMLFADNDDEQYAFAYTFRRLSLGGILIVTIYALANCAGVTILAGVLPLLLLGIRFRLIHWRKIRVTFAPVLLIYGVFVLLILMKFFAGYDLAGNLYSLHFDHSFYAALADYVGNSGIESVNIEQMYPALQSPTIYHWFDVHFAALIGKVSGNFYHARLFVILPLTAGIALLAIATVIEKYVGRDGKTPWLAFLVFFLPVLLLSIIEGKYDFATLPFHDVISEKIYVMICLVAWVILSKNKILPLIVVGLLVSSAAPALFGSASIVLIFRFWSERSNVEYWKNVAAVVFGALWCVAFYTLTAKENPYFIHNLSIEQQISKAFSEFTLPLATETAEVFVERTTLNLALCLLLFALLGKEERSSMISLIKENGVLLLAIPAGLVFACPLWFMRDAMQLATEMSVPVAFVGHGVLFAMLITNSRMPRKIAAGVIIAAGIVVGGFYGNTLRGNRLDADFTRKITAVDGPVVWVDTPERRENGNEYVRDVNYIVPFSVVRRLRNDYFPIRLDVYDIAYDPKDMRDYAVLASIENSTFYRWVESRQIPMKELRNAQTRFIKENNIHYVITPSDDLWINGRGFRIEERTALNSRGYTLFKISYDNDPIQ